MEIDGSYGEGGGQILRTSIALSALLGEPVKITNIRKARPRPGLAQQHRVGIEALGRLSGAEVKGLEMGSQVVEFSPKDLMPGRYEIDIGTAGSISLLLQGLMLPAAFAGGRVEFSIIGGTDVKWSPTIDYLRNVLVPVLERMGYGATIQVANRGYYPKGGGRVVVSVEPVGALEAAMLVERGPLSSVKGISHSLNLPGHIVERQARAAKEALTGYPCEIALEASRDHSRGTGITLWAEYEKTVLGASALGEVGKPAERVGEEAAQRLLREVLGPGVLDVYMGDQILPYLAVAQGRSEVLLREMTNHTKSNIYVVERLLGVKFEVREEGRGYRVGVEGLGFKPS
ncbi:MAG: RNA 3'-terminal phosphate cyclase [Candidatus Hydrothermarchaeota archaeon]|mgnify:CR=1 FL=1